GAISDVSCRSPEPTLRPADALDVPDRRRPGRPLADDRPRPGRPRGSAPRPARGATARRPQAWPAEGPRRLLPVRAPRLGRGVERPRRGGPPPDPRRGGTLADADAAGAGAGRPWRCRARRVYRREGLLR